MRLVITMFPRNREPVEQVHEVSGEVDIVSGAGAIRSGGGRCTIVAPSVPFRITIADSAVESYTGFLSDKELAAMGRLREAVHGVHVSQVIPDINCYKVLTEKGLAHFSNSKYHITARGVETLSRRNSR